MTFRYKGSIDIEFFLSKGVIDNLYNNDFLDDKDYNKIHIKNVVHEKVNTKKERKKDDNFEL